MSEHRARREAATAAAAKRCLADPGQEAESELGSCLEYLLQDHLAEQEWWDRGAWVDGFYVHDVKRSERELTVSGLAIYEDGRGHWLMARSKAWLCLGEVGELADYTLWFGDADRDDEPYTVNRKLPVGEPSAWRVVLRKESGRLHGAMLRRPTEMLRAVLERSGEQRLAGLVGASLLGTDHALAAFLSSDELWGGAGSIADQAGMEQGRGEVRRAIEAALIDLGEQQILAGVVNRRTAMWVDTFRRWLDDGI